MTPDSQSRAATATGRLQDWLEQQEWWTEPLVRVRAVSRLVAPYRRFRFAQFGRDSIIHRPRWLYGTRHISVGDRVLVMSGAWLSVERSAWGAEEPVIRIGERVGIRTNCTLSASSGLVIEDDVVMGGSVTVVDSDHTWSTGQSSVLHSPARSEPIRIGEGSWIGDHVAVLRGANIGRFCLVGANSVVRGEIPDYSIAVGAPARVVGRNDVAAPSDG